jgi:hypothetical protein
MATTTPNFGWPVPTSTDYVKDGAPAIEALGDAIDATVFGLGSSALTLVKSQVVGTGVTSVNVTDAFNSTYDNYKIIWNGGVTSAATNIDFKLGASTTGYYGAYVYGNVTSTSVTGANNNNSATWGFAVSGMTGSAGMNIDLQNPFLAKHTVIMASGVNYVNNRGVYNGDHQVATSYSDFTITSSPITMTGGTIYVYGYKK